MSEGKVTKAHKAALRSGGDFPDDLEMAAWRELLLQARRADFRGDNAFELMSAIDKLVDAKVEAALREYSQRIEASLGVLP